jgi:hypothetical protein
VPRFEWWASIVELFLRDLDAAWSDQGVRPVTLRIIGSTALFLQTDYRRGTKDSDVLETVELSAAVQRQLLAFGGKDTALHRKHRIYLEIVAGAFPFLAVEPRWRNLQAFNASLRSFQVEALDVVDVVIAKLARFHSTDRDDIAAMESRGCIDHDVLIERFHSAVERVWHDARADDLPRIIRGLHWIERDLLCVPETYIDFPPWVEE